MSASMSPQELIYKEFFSQGDLVCFRAHRLLNVKCEILWQVAEVCHYTL